MSARKQNIILYDGVCVLCHRTVRWLLRIDKQGTLRFAPLQGRFAQTVPLQPPGAPSDSVVYVTGYGGEQMRIFSRSDAIIRSIADLGGAWRAILVLKIIPLRVRDALYTFVVRHRYRWFGKYPSCQLPVGVPPDRFLE